MAFEFGEVDSNFYEEEYAHQQKNSFNGTQIPILYLKDGITIVRVLPPHKLAGGKWMRKIYEHQVKVGEKFLTATCPRMNKLDCPICEEGERMIEQGKAEGSNEKVDAGKKYGFSVKYLANVVCYSSPNPEEGSLQKGVMVMKFGSKVRSAILDLDQAVDSGWAKVTDIANGVDLRITRSGRGLNTTYSVMPAQARSNLQAKLAASGIDLGTLTLHNLEDVMNPRSYDDLQAMLAGQTRTPGFLPKPVAAEKAVPVPVAAEPAAPTAPVTNGTVGNAPPVGMVEMTFNGQKVMVPLAALNAQPVVSISPSLPTPTNVPVAVPEVPDSPPAVGLPVREVK